MPVTMHMDYERYEQWLGRLIHIHTLCHFPGADLFSKFPRMSQEALRISKKTSFHSNFLFGADVDAKRIKW
jgi:hypothetical protein